MSLHLSQSNSIGMMEPGPGFKAFILLSTLERGQFLLRYLKTLDDMTIIGHDQEKSYNIMDAHPLCVFCKKN